MTADDVKALVLEEIAANWDRQTSHGVNLRKCVLSVPELRVYKDSFRENSPVELWLVLEENPTTHSGYEVVFDERKRAFGLAIGAVFIGFYGSFLDTMDGM